MAIFRFAIRQKTPLCSVPLCGLLPLSNAHHVRTTRCTNVSVRTQIHWRGGVCARVCTRIHMAMLHLIRRPNTYIFAWLFFFPRGARMQTPRKHRYGYCICFCFKNCRSVFCARIAQKGGFEFLQAGQFSHKGSLRKMGHGFRFDNNMFGIISLDGHETGRQATDLDENFGTPCSF